MVPLKSLTRRICSCPLFIHQTRAISSQPNIAHDDALNQVLVEGRAHSRTVVLNRTSSLNAFTTSMILRLRKLYEAWEENPDIGFVVLKGSGRAFCGGGDVVRLYHLLGEGKTEECKEFFYKSYGFMYLVGTYLKPHVSLLDGITMGGGGGISIPGTFRVATERT
ncbi:3-hydroxyisobutyryl-CoA hydrolase-like protein 1, mitochondrial, partial [Amborella trichopoda]